MDPSRRVRQLWNWIPAFRAVAESEHLPTAAKQMHVSASALSRTVRLLEDDLDMELFHREGRNLRLNAAGERFLRGARDAMRLMHDAVLSVRHEHMVGTMRVSSAGLVTEPYVVPSVHQILRQHPRLTIHLLTIPSDKIVAALIRGQIDAAFLSVQVVDDRVTTTLLGSETNGIYCGREHVLASRAEVALHTLREHDFASPPPDPLGRTWEGWPSTEPRSVRLHISQMAWGLEACAQGDLLSVLPDVIARRDARLVRLPLDVLPTTPIYAITRPGLGAQTRAQIVVQDVGARVAASATP